MLSGEVDYAGFQVLIKLVDLQNGVLVNGLKLLLCKEEYGG